MKKAYTLTEPVELARRNARKSYNYAVLTTASASDTDGYPGPFDGSDATVCVITRGNDCDKSMITNNASLMLTSITLDGDGHRDGREVDHVVVCDGGIVNNAMAAAMLTIDEGATLRNSWVEGNGGAVNAIASTRVYLTGGTISGNSASGFGGAIYTAGTLNVSGNARIGEANKGNRATNGGAVYVAAGAMVEMTGGEISGNQAAKGGAVYVESGATVSLEDTGAGNAFTGNTATSDGAGIYLADGATLRLSGNPSFSNNLSETTLPDNAKNGGEDYTAARQDIYLAGVASEGEALTSITLTDNLSDTIPAGSIWVWAEGEDNTAPNHYYMLKQFAVSTPLERWTTRLSAVMMVILPVAVSVLVILNMGLA